MNQYWRQFINVKKFTVQFHCPQYQTFLFPANLFWFFEKHTLWWYIQLISKVGGLAYRHTSISSFSIIIVWIECDLKFNCKLFFLQKCESQAGLFSIQNKCVTLPRRMRVGRRLVVIQWAAVKIHESDMSDPPQSNSTCDVSSFG